jgi:hypothetical protein
MASESIMKAAAYYEELIRQIPEGGNDRVTLKVGQYAFNINLKTDPEVALIIRESKKAGIR